MYNKNYGGSKAQRTLWGYSSVGRASALHAEGQEFESPYLQKKRTEKSSLFVFCDDRTKIRKVKALSEFERILCKNGAEQ